MWSHISQAYSHSDALFSSAVTKRRRSLLMSRRSPSSFSVNFSLNSFFHDMFHFDETWYKWYMGKVLPNYGADFEYLLKLCYFWNCTTFRSFSQFSSDFDKTWYEWYEARDYKVTEQILNICINYASWVTGAQLAKLNRAISTERL